MLEIKDITKSYRMGTAEHQVVVQALKSVSLTVEDGDFVAIMGPSGSGKSTLTQILGLLDVPDTGSYKLNGRETAKLNEDELAELRREEIGFIFQQFNLLPRMTASENVALPLLYTERNLDRARADEVLAKVGLGTRVLHRPNELSGGQQQRVAIARSLINRPRMILADEPTGNLDSNSEKEILGILRELNEQGITVIVVTHEEEVGAMAKRIIRMRDGVIVSDERREPVSIKQAIANEHIAGALDLQKSAKGFQISEIFEHFVQGYRTLAANKVRTALSMLGILIGVAAVVAMLALGNGAQKSIEAQLASLGSNLLVLRPGAVRVGGVAQQAGAVTRLTLEDAQALRERVPGLKEVAPQLSGRAQATYLNKNWSTQVLGAGPAYGRMHASLPAVGRFFTIDEVTSRARVAVIGMTLVRELFDGGNPIGELIKLNKVSFQVIGILPEKGSNGFRDQDDIVVVPVTTAMRRLLGKDYVDTVELEVADADQTAAAQESILAVMLDRKRVPTSQKQEPFEVRNMADIQAALSESSRTMGVLLASIAAISLIVGGIGIMNIMLVSVTERTREIGLRKAIGARRRDILLQFLAESVVVSAIGGLAGICLGWGATVALSTFAGWATQISPESVFLAFFFSAGIGVFFGIYPAKKASMLNPIDALRND